MLNTPEVNLLVTMSDSDLDKGNDVARSSRIVVHNNSKKAKDMLAIYNLIPEFGHPGSNLVICGKYFDKDTLLFVAGKPVPVTRPCNTTTILQAVLPNLGLNGPQSVVIKKKDRIVESPMPLQYFSGLDHACFSPHECQFCNCIKLMAPMFHETKTKKRTWQSEFKNQPQRQQLTDWHLSNPSMSTTNMIPPWTEPMPNCEYHWPSIPTARNPAASSPQLGFSGFPDQGGIQEMSSSNQATYLDLTNASSPQMANQGNNQRFQHSPFLQNYQLPYHFQGSSSLLSYSPPYSVPGSPNP
ncbi:transcription factor collier [Caerostris darwini]|uniref:Transcription factor collier n=1 Tax=Caerostris darwini TaxID=1538125 RepID=A0AAV4NHS4_9ARAC|nr:transcription factor collier [Caerostris darwini]